MYSSSPLLPPHPQASISVMSLYLKWLWAGRRDRDERIVGRLVLHSKSWLVKEEIASRCWVHKVLCRQMGQQRTSFVPNVFASLMDANICSMSCFSHRASTQEDLTSDFHVIVKQIWCDKKRKNKLDAFSVNWSVQNEAVQSLFSITKDVINRTYTCHVFYKYSLT